MGQDVSSMTLRSQSAAGGRVKAGGLDPESHRWRNEVREKVSLGQEADGVD